jgi:hypothetical protein
LAASRHLCPHLSIQLQGSKEHWGQSPPYGKFLATPLIHMYKSTFDFDIKIKKKSCQENIFYSENKLSRFSI